MLGSDCVPDIATVFSVKPPDEAMGNAQLMCLDFSLLKRATTFPAGVEGFYFHSGRTLDGTDYETPLRATFHNCDDFVVLAVKLVEGPTGPMCALWGLSLDALVNFKAPAKLSPGKEIVDLSDRMCTTYVLPHADLKELTPLVNTYIYFNLVKAIYI